MQRFAYQSRDGAGQLGTGELDAEDSSGVAAQLRARGLTPVSVSHHAAILKFHHQVLELPGDGAWSLHAARGYHWA